MTKSAGQAAEATLVPPAPAADEDPFGLSPWLKEMPAMAVPPLMAHPVAAMAAATAIGLGISSQFAGMVAGAVQGFAERTRAALDEAAEVEAKVVAAWGPARDLGAEPGEAVAREAVAAPARLRSGAPVKAPARKARPAKRLTPKAAPAAAAPEKGAIKPATVRKGSGPMAGGGDDLKLISGIGPKLEQALNGKGILRLADIARWTASDVEQIEAEFGLDGRIARDGWVEQAKKLARGRG